MKSLSCVQLFATLWTVAYQASPSMGFSRQEYWSGLPFPSPGDLSDPGIEPRSPALEADTLTSEPPGKHTSKVMLKILQARLQRYLNHELPEFKMVLEKAKEPEIKLPASIRSSKKQESSRKTSISALLTMPKPLTVWITINSGKF